MRPTPTPCSSGRSSRARIRSPRPPPPGRPGFALVVAGPRKDERLARELEAAGAEVRGYVSKEELAALYRPAACVVLPTRYEGFGLPALEAMASGTPVVAAPDPALREVAGDAALYAERGELADAIRARRRRP